MRTVTLHGGPLDGTKETLKDPFDSGTEPAAIGLVVNGDGNERAWYKRDEGGEYRFDKTEGLKKGNPCQ